MPKKAMSERSHGKCLKQFYQSFSDKSLEFALMLQSCISNFSSTIAFAADGWNWFSSRSVDVFCIDVKAHEL